jgi:IclR family acetate operon transcriptional repressor
LYDSIILATSEAGASVMPAKAPRSVQSVDRAILILQALSTETGGLALRDLAARLFLPPQTVQSLLRTLELHDFVLQDGRGAPYQLGDGIRRLAGNRPSRDERGRLAHGPVLALANEIGESVLLDELTGRSAAGIAQARFEHALAVNPDSEGFQRLHTMATGKVLLAALPAPQRAIFVHGLNLSQRTPHTITDPDLLLGELQQVAAQGWAETLEEAVLGVAALAVPIPCPPGLPPASLGTCLPTARYTPERRPVLLAALQECAQDIADAWSVLKT